LRRILNKVPIAIGAAPLVNFAEIHAYPEMCEI